MDPIELAKKAAMTLFKAEQFLAAAIVYGEGVKLAPGDPEMLLGFGAAVGNSAGVLVIKPFVHWSTRILNRCLAVQPDGPFSKIAKQRLADLSAKPEYVALPAMEPDQLDPLVAYLDIDPATILPAAIDAIAADDRMFAIIALGEMKSPRFWGVMAGAVSGTWGPEVARAGLKRVMPYAANSVVRSGMETLRKSALGEECDPYLEFAERNVASVPITVTPGPPARVEPPPAIPVGPAAGGDKKPWWRFW